MTWRTLPNFGGGVKVDGITVIGAQQAAIASLTDSSGGTADGTVAAVSGSGADADINNNFAEGAAKIASILTAMRTHGLIVT